MNRGLLSAPGLLLLVLFVGCGDKISDRTTDAFNFGAGQNAVVQQPGEWLLVNYWATWCKPCLEEIPELNAFMHENTENARILAVNFDGIVGAELQQEAARLGFEVAQLEADPAAIFGYDRPTVLPTTVVLAPDGTVSKVLVGPQSRASLARAIGQDE